MKIKVDIHQLRGTLRGQTVLIEADKDQIWVSPVGIIREKDFLPGERIETGSIIVNAGELALLLYKFVDEGELTLSSEDDRLTVEGRAREGMDTLSIPKDYKVIANVENLSFVRRASFAAARRDYRHALMMVHLRFSDDKLIATATDGICIAQSWGPAAVSIEREYLVGVDAVKKIAKSPNGTIYERGRMLQWPDGLFTEVQAGQEAPSFEEHLVKKPIAGAVVDRKEMLKAIKDEMAVKLELKNDDPIEWTWYDGLAGVVEYRGNPVKTKLNMKMWMAGLRAAKDEYVHVWLTENMTRIEADGFKYLQVGMR